MDILEARRWTVFMLVVSLPTLLLHALAAIDHPTLTSVTRLGGTAAWTTLGAMWMHATKSYGKL